MTYPIYQIDAFSRKVFGGNPAAVVPLANFLPDDLLLQIAAENNLSETAYLVQQSTGHYRLRWFTPKGEVQLCGHATLAAAHAIWQIMGDPTPTLQFETKSGILTAKQVTEGILVTLPADDPRPVADRSAVEAALGSTAQEVHRGNDDLIAILPKAADVASLDPDFRAIAHLDSRGLIATAQSDDNCIVCRCFYPKYGIDEDPVTGSAHAALIPLWTTRLNTNCFTSHQISERGGQVKCIYKGPTVGLIGHAATYLQGNIGW